MELDPSEWVQIQLLADGIIEPLTSKLIKELLPHGGTFVDVGAHVGFHSIKAAKLVGKEGKVIAIDPQPYNCERILRNCIANEIENVTVHVAAAGSHDGFVTLQNQVASDKARLTLQGAGASDSRERFVVPIRRLDSIIRDAGLTKIDLLKIDVEGFEDEVLRGLEYSITGVQNIILEILESNSEFARSAGSFLVDHGFSLKTISGAPWKIGDICIESNIHAQRQVTTIASELAKDGAKQN